MADVEKTRGEALLEVEQAVWPAMAAVIATMRSSALANRMSAFGEGFGEGLGRDHFVSPRGASL